MSTADGQLDPRYPAEPNIRSGTLDALRNRLRQHYRLLFLAADSGGIAAIYEEEPKLPRRESDRVVDQDISSVAGPYPPNDEHERDRRILVKRNQGVSRFCVNSRGANDQTPINVRARIASEGAEEEA